MPMRMDVPELAFHAGRALTTDDFRIRGYFLALAARSLRQARCVAMAVHVTVLVDAASAARARRDLGIN